LSQVRVLPGEPFFCAVYFSVISGTAAKTKEQTKEQAKTDEKADGDTTARGFHACATGSAQLE
jgi:hypothetical protein